MDPDNIFISHEFKVNILRVIGKNILPLNLSVASSIVPMEDNVPPSEMATILKRLNFFTKYVLPNSIMYNVYDRDALSVVHGQTGKSFNNNYIMSPLDCSDDTIAMLLQAKLTSLCEGKFHFIGVEVDSQNEFGLKFTFSGEEIPPFPDISEWIGDEYYFDVPWWYRADGSTLDIPPNKGDDITIEPLWATNLDFLSNKSSSGNTPTPTFKASSGSGSSTQFQPTVIEGGKKRKRK